MAAREYIEPGTKFNDLTFSTDVEIRKGIQRHALFVCICGTQITARLAHVKSGLTRSCGCLIAKRNKERSTHGHAGRGNISPEYSVWAEMKKRCDNERHEYFADYGGRGIMVCDRWRDFTNFFADMGKRPEGLTLDRIETNGNYELGNCRWATVLEQANNRRITPMVTYQGRTQSIANWARELGFAYWSLRKRLRTLGWSIERAFNTQMVIGRNQFD